ncbi:hypothetical protein J3459_015807 [Metarhizium acridum]|nr:hypothetical protein J3459_015807 [Metarhizium acridum]
MMPSNLDSVSDKLLQYSEGNPWLKTQSRLTIVRGIWRSEKFYQQSQYKDIDAATFRDLQKAPSKYYTQKAEGKAYLIFPHDQKSKKDGIFWNVKINKIISHGKVDKVIWVDQNKIGDGNDHKKDETRIYWKKGDEKPDCA